MDDLGKPSSYLALEPGAPIYSCDGEKVGKVERVLREPDADIFEGITLDGDRFVKGEQVEEIFEGGVLLKIEAQQLLT